MVAWSPRTVDKHAGVSGCECMRARARVEKRICMRVEVYECQHARVGICVNISRHRYCPAGFYIIHSRIFSINHRTGERCWPHPAARSCVGVAIDEFQYRLLSSLSMITHIPTPTEKTILPCPRPHFFSLILFTPIHVSVDGFSYRSIVFALHVRHHHCLP